MYPFNSVVTPQNIVFTPYFTPDGFGGAGSAARIKSRNAVGGRLRLGGAQPSCAAMQGRARGNGVWPAQPYDPVTSLCVGQKYRGGSSNTNV